MAQFQALQAQGTAGDILIALHREQTGSPIVGGLSVSLSCSSSLSMRKRVKQKLSISAHTLLGKTVLSKMSTYCISL